ncbi:MAG TPA: gamma-glutamyl-gamma-aminobutyrate hydrolase family protein [Candidatus Sulfotelmatobacter sp.]
MPPRIAIPMPHSTDPEYAERAIPQYERAVRLAGGEPVRIPLGLAPDAILKMAEQCDGILLPGSKADVDPSRFGEDRSTHTAPADLHREMVDNLLLREAYDKRKPVLGICYGLQSLNVFRGGTLIQHIPDLLSEPLRATVDHDAGRQIAVAHTVKIESGSELGKIVGHNGSSAQNRESQNRHPIHLPVNSSHHQSAERIGQGLQIVARCAEDGIIEALEGTASDHFVLAVQWHPERSVYEDEASRAIFSALIAASR